MTNIQKTNPVARRNAIIIVTVSAIAGFFLILVIQSYRSELHQWLLSDPGKPVHRLKILIILVAAFGAIPLFSFSVYLWILGCKVSSFQRFPLPGQRVIRDTPILEGQSAMARANFLKTLAVFLAAAGVILCFVFWRLLSKLDELVV